MLQFSELTEVFPNWTSSSRSLTPDQYITNYSNTDALLRPLPPNVRELTHLNSEYPIGKNDFKFRVIDGKMHVDTRRFQNIRRKISGDSRWEILKIIKDLVNKYSYSDDIIKVAKIMYNGCYKNDEKWKTALNEIIPESFLNDRGSLPSILENIPIIKIKSKNVNENSDAPPPYTIGFIVESSK